jgi:hypothetical protein
VSASRQIAALSDSAPANFDSARVTYEMAKADAYAPHDYELSDDECMLLGTAHSDATWAMIFAPAPDLAALAYKLEAFEAEECFALNDEYRQPMVVAMIADVRRLGKL